MSESKINNVFSEAELVREATVANFATVQKQFNVNWSPIATANKM
jgi:hypothetical protein